jgi:hypothetical protein
MPPSAAGPSAEPGDGSLPPLSFEPTAFTVEGDFAWDPELGTLLPWTEHEVVAQATGVAVTFLGAADAPRCVARLSFASSGPDAPSLGGWEVEEPVETTFGPEISAIHTYRGFLAAPAGVDHDCPPVAAETFGTEDVADLLRDFRWGVAFGTRLSSPPEEVGQEAFGGAILGDALAVRGEAWSPNAWSVALELDENHETRHDVRDQSALLLEPAEVLDVETPPRAVYRVTADRTWDVALLAP